MTLLRVCQGLGVGGEWGGSVLLSMEWGHRGKRGLIASWPQVGVAVGLLLSTGMVALVSAFSGPNFLVWGWRIPFLSSIVLVAIGLYIRLGILETPLFAQLLREQRIEEAPVVEVVRRNWKEIILSALLRLPEQAPFYIFTVFIYAYGTDKTAVNFPRGFLLNAVMVAACVSFISIPLFGYISDVIGRKRMYLIGVAAVALYAVPYFAMLNSRVPALVFLAIVLSLVPHDAQYGPQAAFIAESFTGRLRYSGASIGYQLASVVAGGPAPYIAAYLFGTYKNAYVISAYIILIAIVGFVAAALLRERSKQDISVEYEEREAGKPAAPRVAPVV